MEEKGKRATKRTGREYDKKMKEDENSKSYRYRRELVENRGKKIKRLRNNRGTVEKRKEKRRGRE